MYQSWDRTRILADLDSDHLQFEWEALHSDPSTANLDLSVLDDCVVAGPSGTRIIANNGHREMSLVLAVKFFSEKTSPGH